MMTLEQAERTERTPSNSLTTLEAIYFRRMGDEDLAFWQWIEAVKVRAKRMFGARPETLDDVLAAIKMNPQTFADECE